MKTYKLAGLILLAGCWFGVSAKADNTYTVSPRSSGDFTAFDTDFDGNGNTIDSLTAPTLTAGIFNNGSTDRAERSLVSFTLPTIVAGEQIVSATLVLTVTSVTNSGSLGNAELYWSNSSSTLATNYSSSYYQNSTFVDTGLTVATPSTTAGTTVSIDVTSFVESDYASAGSVAYSWFRVDVDGMTYALGDPTNRYSFASTDNTNSAILPELVIVTAAIPEPATYAYRLAALMGLVGGLTIFKRRHSGGGKQALG